MTAIYTQYGRLITFSAWTQMRWLYNDSIVVFLRFSSPFAFGFSSFHSFSHSHTILLCHTPLSPSLSANAHTKTFSKHHVEKLYSISHPPYPPHLYPPSQYNVCTIFTQHWITIAANKRLAFNIQLNWYGWCWEVLFIYTHFDSTLYARECSNFI